MRNIRKLPEAIRTYDTGWKATTMAFFRSPRTTHAHLSLNAAFPPLQGGAACHDCFPLAPPPPRFPTLAVGGITRSVGGQAEEEWGGGKREVEALSRDYCRLPNMAAGVAAGVARLRI